MSDPSNSAPLIAEVPQLAANPRHIREGPMDVTLSFSGSSSPINSNGKGLNELRSEDPNITIFNGLVNDSSATAKSMAAKSSMFGLAASNDGKAANVPLSHVEVGLSPASDGFGSRDFIETVTYRGESKSPLEKSTETSFSDSHALLVEGFASQRFLLDPISAWLQYREQLLREPQVRILYGMRPQTAFNSLSRDVWRAQRRQP
ncbi:unnamed protein product [Phytophthora lilii]|uniref:Unnamed protein product n=1 Tax=Phytophthora lilii TaxID=2077276 RepID=A0A9W6WT32_9STRA|nr:unnamed protein product [Phytophthora lilii]